MIGHRNTLASAVVAAFPLLAAPALAGDCAPAPVGCDQKISISYLGRYASGIYNNGGTEIAAYDARTKRAFTVNFGSKTIEIIDLSDPSMPTLIGSIPMAPYGSAANSVAVRNGLVACAVEAIVRTDPGQVVFFDTNGTFLGSVGVGALPDMVTFTPDGTKVLVANEGEPSTDYAIDPAGSVSIIDISAGVGSLTPANVTTAGFGSVPSIDPEIELNAPNATYANDLEPEYIAISSDGATAWVTLQEANAIGILDINAGAFTALRWLGQANHGRGTPVLTTATLLNPPALGTTVAGQTLYLGGFSGLWFESIDSATGKIRFLTHTDRGPNAEPVNVDADPALERCFALPDFQPRIVRLEFDPTAGTVVIVDEIFLKDSDGSAITGLPNILGQSAGLAHTDEEPCDLFGQPLPLDPMGLDLEGIVKTPDGSIWMGDEYRPSIVRFDASGTLIARYVPEGSNAFGSTVGIEAFPPEYAQRRANRGFEAIAQYDGTVFAWIQSPIDNPDVANDASSKASKSTCILKFDPVTEATTGQYLYRQEGSGSDKIGDAVAIGRNRFLVVERDDGTGPNTKKKIFEIDLTNATDLSTLPSSVTGPGGTLELMNDATLAANGIVPVKKTLVVDLAAIGYTNVADKVEGLAMIDPSRFAVIGDNDFQMGGTFNTATGLFTPNANPLPSVLGYITFTGQGLDPSDQDGGVKIGSWPVMGQFRPDAIASFSADGQEYTITANEGDAREWSAYAEEAACSSVTLDPNTFPNRAWLQANSRLGRLRVIQDQGDFDGDGDIDEIRSFGGRSVTVRDAAGNVVWDSGDLLEQVTAATFPTFFNSNNTSNTSFDGRSRNKGPEPEGVDVGEVNGEQFAFVALERIGGIAAFGLADPTEPSYQQYVNSRVFTGSPSGGTAGDLGPEGVRFVSAKDSPIDSAILLVANEISGTLSVYAIDPVCGSEQGDINADCVIDAADLAILLGAWGPCPRAGTCSSDLNDDGTVDAADLAILLGAWS